MTSPLYNASGPVMQQMLRALAFDKAGRAAPG